MAKKAPLFIILLFFFFTGSPALSGPADWYKSLDPSWGGHVKIRGIASKPGTDSIFKPVGTGVCYDGYAETRIKNKMLLGDWGVFDIQYQALLSGGETRKKLEKLKNINPVLAESLLTYNKINDDSRLINMTWTISDNNDYYLLNRFDRLYLGIEKDWGSIKLGRQAITWGHGMIFSPMDILNPFAPTDIDRDYKVGDDMAVVNLRTDNAGTFQAVYVPGRNPETENATWDQTALGGKWGIFFGQTEVDLIFARDLKDYVTGIGMVGYIGNAAWRFDYTYTFLKTYEKGSPDGFSALVANIDYSWIWWKKNWYGFLEFYYNGLGENNYSKALSNKDLMDRIYRGQMFTMGKNYLAGNLRWEATPLFNVYATIINNLRDPSGIIMPRCVWSSTQNTQVTFGATLYYGREGTEYGGFEIPGTDGILYESPPQAFLWFTWFF